LARARRTAESKTALGRLDRFAEIERIGRRHGARGLPAGFIVDKFWLYVGEARRLALQKELRAAATMALRGAVTLLGSPGALRHFFRLCVARVRSRRARA
jgi:hypothetical protein